MSVLGDIRLDDYGYGVPGIVQVLHDEKIVETPDKIADEVAKIVKSFMEGVFNRRISNAPFKV